MVRSCFEVSSFVFRFSSYETTLGNKRDFVCEGLNRSLKKYSSNTSLSRCQAEVDYGDIVVYVELSKEISLNTVINILGQMYADTGYELSIKYGQIQKIVTVSVLR